MQDEADEQSEATRNRVQAAFTAAHLYWVQQHTSEAVAVEMGVSRSTVSRLLTLAREQGIVEIRVRSPLHASDVLASQIRGGFGITATVVPVPDDATDADRLSRVSAAAAHVLNEVIESDTVVGLAWGSTMAEVSRHLLHKPSSGVTFVQLNGSGNSITSGVLYASELMSRFARAYEGKAQQFPVPAFFDSPQTKDAMWRERSTRRILELQQHMQTVVFSVGVAADDAPSHVYAAGYLDSKEVHQLRASGVVGDVATVFYRDDGTSDNIALNDRATGPSLETLRTVPRRVCVVSGARKVASLRGAIRSGLVSDLVIDTAAARHLVGADGVA